MLAALSAALSAASPQYPVVWTSCLASYRVLDLSFSQDDLNRSIWMSRLKVICSPHAVKVAVAAPH